MKVGLEFEDKRLEFRVMRELSKWGIPCEITNHTINEYSIVLSDHSVDGAIIVSDPMVAVRKVVSFTYGKNRFLRVIVGIDPGPMPGLAVIGDGHVVEEIQLTSVEEVYDSVKNIHEGYAPEKFVVKIGNGDIVNRNRIINALIPEFLVEIVDEKSTSDTITNRNVEAAKHIAFVHGHVVRDPLNIVIKDGYLREIQRRSRIESGGKITISKTLARDVALGKIKIDEAIERMREER